MSKTEKRNMDSESNLTSPTKKRKLICTFLEKCYRKNPHHFVEYSHPHLEILLDLNKEELDVNIPDSYVDKSIILEQIKILRDIEKPADVWQNFQNSTPSTSTSATNESTITKINSKLSFLPKLKCNAPYNLFFTVIPKSPQTRNQSNCIEFTELLCPSLGKLKCSLQINFMIDIMWLMEQYAKTGNEKKPLTILYGEDFPKMQEYMNKFLPNVTHHLVKMKDPFGTHHSKVGIYAYENGSIRIVVSTANLYSEDWTIYCQSLWVSPSLPELPSDKPDTEGSGPTDFKGSLISYLLHYKLPILDEWIKRIQRVDFSRVKVFFVSSVPGKFAARSGGCHLQRMGDLLSRHCTLPYAQNTGKSLALHWNIIAQSSSLGNFGPNPTAWLRSALLRSLASHEGQPRPLNSNAKLSIIYPSQKNVLESYYGPEGGGCLPYSRKTHEKQKWLEGYLHEWKADRTKRTRAMPHIKSYCRISPEHDKLAYFLLTSANISKAAWGTLDKDFGSYVRSYEVGVLFLPKFFDETYFVIDAKFITTNKFFPIMYDLPLVPYKPDDVPWQQ